MTCPVSKTLRHSGLTMIATLGLAGGAWAADLTVDVAGITKTEGQIFVALFNSADGFPRKAYWKGQEAAPSKGAVRVVFRDIPEGTYAVTAYQDLDGNKKLNTNGLGIPTEPLAFSRDAVAEMDGPPKFSKASFKVGAQSMSINLTLK
jgi:uncharacterized protein (DUF2141 family)